MEYNEITIFINQILDEKNLTITDSKVRDQLVADMEKRLMDQINRAIIEAIPEPKLVEFEKLAKSEKNDTAVQKFLAVNSVDTQKITIATMVRFKDLYLGKVR